MSDIIVDVHTLILIYANIGWFIVMAVAYYSSRYAGNDDQSEIIFLSLLIGVFWGFVVPLFVILIPVVTVIKAGKKARLRSSAGKTLLP